jgi:hypothetical protein
MWFKNGSYNLIFEKIPCLNLSIPAAFHFQPHQLVHTGLKAFQ